MPLPALNLLNTTYAWAGLGAALFIGDGGSPETFTSVPAMMDSSGPKISTTIADVTVHDNTDGFVQNIPILLDGGTVDFTIVFDPTSAQHNETVNGLRYLQLAKVVRNMRLTMFTSPTTRNRFRGFVINMSATQPVKDALKSTVSIRISGKPTLESGTGTGA